MIKISEITKEILLNDEVALVAYKERIINLSSYARTIKSEVEEKELELAIRKLSVV